LPGNGLRTTVASDIVAGSTTLPIAAGDASKWPTGGEYRAVLCQDPTNGPFEVVRVTGGQGTASLTVTRAVEPYNGDQTARSWVAGTAVSAVITHDSLQQTSGVTFPLLAPDGLQTAPSYSFVNSPAAGLWSPSANTINLIGSGGVNIYASGGSVRFGRNGVTSWLVNASNHLQPSDTNTWDIGVAGAYPRTVYASTSFLAGDGSAGVPSLGFMNIDGGLFNQTGYPVMAQSGSPVALFSLGSGLTLNGQTFLGWASGAPGQTTHDVRLYRDAADVLAMRRTTNAQALRIYNTFTDVNNYERGFFRWSFGIFETGTEYAGTGQPHAYRLTANGGGDIIFSNNFIDRWRIEWQTGNLLTWTDNAYDIGAAGANRPRNLFLAGGMDVAGGVTIHSTTTLTAPLIFSPDNTYDIGASGATRPRNMYLGGYQSLAEIVTPSVIPAAGSLFVYPKADHLVYALDSLGNEQLLSAIGAAYMETWTWSNVTSTPPNAQQVRSNTGTWASGTATLYFDKRSTDGVDRSQAFAVMASGDQIRLSQKTDSTRYVQFNVTGPAVNNTGWFSVPVQWTQSGGVIPNTGTDVLVKLMTQGAAGNIFSLPLTQNLTFAPDNTYDIGATATSRPRTLYLGTSMVTPGWTNGTNLLANTDNTYDIGASGANRPRNVYVGGTLNVAGQSTLTGNVAIGATPQAQWALYMNGGAHYGNVCVVDNFVGYSNVTESMFIAAGRTSGGGVQSVFVSHIEAPSSASTWAEAIETKMQTQNASFTIPWLIGLRANSPTIQGSSLVTNTAGIYLHNMGSAGVTNAYGIYINAPSGASGSNIGLRNLGTSQLDGSVGVGTPPATTIGINVQPSTLTSSTQYGIYAFPSFNAAATGGGEGIIAGVVTAAAAFTMGVGRALHAYSPTLGAGSAITTMTGVLVENQGKAGIGNAFGIAIAAQSGASTTNIGLWNQGTSQFDGLVGMGVVPFAGTTLLLRGATNTSAQFALQIQNSTPANLFYVRNDGYVFVCPPGGAGLSFFGAAGSTKATVSGAKGSNAALGSVIAALVAYGLITDTTTA